MPNTLSPPSPTRPRSPAALARDAAALESEPPESLLRWAIDRFGDRLVLCTSFQAEGMVLLDMATRIEPGLRIVTLDTGRLPQETYDMIENVRSRYGVEIEISSPDTRDLEALLHRDGPNGFYRSHDARLACCHVRKVAPLRRALADADAWITGLRRDQSRGRAQVAKVAHDPNHGRGTDGMIKLSPLADWDWQRVWDYIELNDVPYHPLYDHGYTSIGCAPCTRAVRPGADARSGRWWWERGAVKECGLHVTPPTEDLLTLVATPVAGSQP